MIEKAGMGVESKSGYLLWRIDRTFSCHIQLMSDVRKGFMLLRFFLNRKFHIVLRVQLSARETLFFRSDSAHFFCLCLYLFGMAFRHEGVSGRM